MFGFESWWLLALLPLPLLLRRLLPAVTAHEIAIAVPLLERHIDAAGRPGTSASRWRGVGLWIFWIALLCAASRPYWLGEALSRTVSGRDMIMAVDISGSMSETDMLIDARNSSRLDALKLVAQDFISRRDGDRLGLILFGTNAYNYVPLTFDLESLRELLLDVSTGLAGRHTAIGDAIGIAIKSMLEQDARHKVLILITDGSNTAGFENPVQAAAAAAREGLTIYTIGVGSEAAALRRIYGNVPSGLALNQALLRKIAAVSGGRYFRASSGVELEQIYRDLDRLEPIEHQYRSYRPRRELFRWPLALALAALLLTLALDTPLARSKKWN